MVKVQLMPLYDKIVVEIDDKQDIKSETGLTYTKDMSISKNTIMAGRVTEVGCGRLMADGNIVPLIVKVGDKVIYSKMQGENYNDGEKDYTILSESCILAILKGE